jgi:hypothetical protein
MTVTSLISQHHLTSLVKTAVLKRILCTDRERNFTGWQRYKDCQNINRTDILHKSSDFSTYSLMWEQYMDLTREGRKFHKSSDVLIMTNSNIRILNKGMPCKFLDRYCIISKELSRTYKQGNK